MSIDMTKKTMKSELQNLRPLWGIAKVHKDGYPSGSVQSVAQTEPGETLSNQLFESHQVAFLLKEAASGEIQVREISPEDTGKRILDLLGEF